MYFYNKQVEVDVQDLLIVEINFWMSYKIQVTEIIMTEIITEV